MAGDFCTREIRWAPDGKGLILLDKDVFCCAFEVEEDPAVADAGAEEPAEDEDASHTEGAATVVSPCMGCPASLHASTYS